jgi:4-amino-4-deoxy-L-arabinose transferase-like glycosyltransferase
MSQKADAKTVNAIAAFLPLLKALILTAEEAGKPAGASGEDKHKAVVQGAESLWTLLQGSVKELRGIDWETVAPMITPVTGGLVSIVVGMWNSLFGKVWGFFSGLFKDDDE